jgi:hypothetical protein
MHVLQVFTGRGSRGNMTVFWGEDRSTFKKAPVTGGGREHFTATTFISPPDDVIWHIIN